MRHAVAGFRVTAVKMMLHFIIAQSEGFVMGGIGGERRGSGVRKILTGTTALVAASALAGRAEASPALQLGISGFYRNSIGLQGMYSQWQELGKMTDEVMAAISLNGSYTLGPGVSLEGQLAYTHGNYGDVGFGGSPIPSVWNVELDFGTDIDI
jgi:hypothetical protein